MRGHRHPAALTGAAIAIAATTGALALVLPWARESPTPSAGDLAAGLALLAAGCAATVRRPVIGAVTLTAGVVWVAVGVAPLYEGLLADGVVRLALVPTALLVVALALLGGGDARWRTAAVVAGALAIAGVGGAGPHRFAMVAFGACLLVLLVGRHRARTASGGAEPPTRGTAAVAWIAVGLIVVGLVGALDLTGPAFVTNLHELVVAIGGAVVAVLVVEARAEAGSDPVLGALTNGLGTALGHPLAAIAFPIAAGSEGAVTWVDAAGCEQRPDDSGGEVLGPDGTPVAWLAPPLGDSDRDPELLQLLTVARDVARLRAELRRQAAEIERSTERLETAVDSERARLAAMLEAGPIAALGEVAPLLDREPVSPELRDRLRSAERALREAVHGIDPIERGRLSAALQQLAIRFSAEAQVDPSADDLPPEVARLVWFTCAEGLANAAKHAPGAPVAVALRCSATAFELEVADGGAGGADPRGPGLARLAIRATEVGASMTVESAAGGGTRLTLSGVRTPDRPFAAAPGATAFADKVAR